VVLAAKSQWEGNQMTLFRFLQAGVVTALTLWALNYVHPLLMAIGVAFLVDLLQQAFLSFSKEEGAP
jgi:hypothetical protein